MDDDDGDDVPELAFSVTDSDPDDFSDLYLEPHTANTGDVDEQAYMALSNLSISCEDTEYWSFSPLAPLRRHKPKLETQST